MNNERRRKISSAIYEIDKLSIKLKNVLGDELEAYYDRPENLQKSESAERSNTAIYFLYKAIEKLKCSEEILRKLI